uniref:Catenin alpha-2 n=1 Tax=Prolemur simus TaxID=1328070 RepID=A0A8C9AA76_PROSS
GETMRIASSEFADDPCSSVKRGTMVRAARALLSAVTRLLILADMADVMRLLSHLKIVEEALEAVKNATNEQDLANRFKEFGKEMVKLNYVAARRQQELKDPHCRDEMAAARGALKKNATMLYTASQAFLRHPDVAATRANRDYVFKQVQEAIAGISNAAQATSPTDEAKGHTGIGELAAALNEFDNKIILDPMTFSEARFRPSLEERLESIISGAALMADSSCTRDDRRERIVAECNAVRQALQDLLSEYMNNVSLGLSVLTSRWIQFRDLVALAKAWISRERGQPGVPQRESGETKEPLWESVSPGVPVRTRLMESSSFAFYLSDFFLVTLVVQF